LAFRNVNYQIYNNGFLKILEKIIQKTQHIQSMYSQPNHNWMSNRCTIKMCGYISVVYVDMWGLVFHVIIYFTYLL
jgi:hypothetical protein